MTLLLCKYISVHPASNDFGSLIFHIILALATSQTRRHSYYSNTILKQGGALAVPGGPWRLTFAP